MAEAVPDYGFHKNLGIGEIIVSEKKEEIIWTVLGSCISVIFHLPGQVSMICHSQLPADDFKGECTDECPHPCRREFNRYLANRYVKCSLDYMIGKLDRYRYDPAELRTSLIGGATIIDLPDLSLAIGTRNVRMAKDILGGHRIRINREKTGGVNGYNLWYHTDTDRLFVRTVDEGMGRFELFGENAPPPSR